MSSAVRQYAFAFDASSCSGCKACQVACKDKHGLSLGQLWRRVYEVSGGEWQKRGDAWRQSVFAYSLSIACNHCENPACMDACPTRAIGKREDGIVLIDADRCMGCQYCSWACPYGALQFDHERGRMTKCTFCADAIENDVPPACVAACPMRALSYGDVDVLRAQHGRQPHVVPLPEESITTPALVVLPHGRNGDAKDGSTYVRGPQGTLQ